MIERNTPVIVGAGQTNGCDGATEPMDLIGAAAQAALGDAGGSPLPIDLVAMSKVGTKAYWNAPRLLAERLGVEGARTLQASHGGHTVQVVLCHIAAEIAAGRTQAAVLAGGELGSSLKRAPSGGGAPAEEPSVPDLALGDDLSQWIAHPHEIALGISEPIQLYPVMETALGAALGRKREEHLAAIAALWARFAEVAKTNPFAADPTGYSAEEIGEAGPRNRYVGFPYTKLMNSNQFVDQGAALVLCSAGAAMDAGIPRDQWVFPLAGASVHSPFVSERWALHESPALSAAADAVGHAVGRSLDEASLVDLYACFPFAVQTQANAIGLDPAQELTLTGGMRFAGGPWNNYGMHMLANVVGRVREEPDALALCCTNGGLATRFCLAAYSGTPRADGFWTSPYPFVDPGPRRRLETAPSGEAWIEAYTVMHDRSNTPVEAIAACLLPDGARAWARIDEAPDVDAILAADPIGRSVRIDGARARLA